jgi:D-alanyl-D-alanine carboxypeptidase
MTTSRRTVLTAALGIAAAALAPTAPAHAAPADRRTRRTALRRALDDVVAAGAAGALAEVHDGSDRWRAASGTAELRKSRPVPVDGRFRVGSLTKSFVATVVLQLVAECDVRLDDTVERWLPGLVPAGADITVRHLLTHTSGVYDYVEALPIRDPEQFLRIRWRTWDPRDLVALATARPPLFQPGARWQYSSTNYILLGLIVERATGRAYGAEVERRIIRPLRLRHTSLPGTSPVIPGPHAHGYLPVMDNGEVTPVDITARNPSMMWAAGEVISTAADLNRFHAALIGGRLLPAVGLRELTTAVAGSERLEHWGDGGPVRCASTMGLRRCELPSGVTVYGTDGNGLGYETWSYVTGDTSRRVTVSITPWGPGEPRDAVLALLGPALGPEAGAA